MGQRLTNRSSAVYQTAVSISGTAVWMVAVVQIFARHGWRDHLMLLALVPAIIAAGMFVQHLRLPVGLKFSRDRVGFTLTDAFVLLVACWFGPFPAVFLAGIEGFTSSRRTARRLSSNFFSSAMMSLGAAGASVTIGLVLRYGFSEETGTGPGHALMAVAVAMLMGSVVQIAMNIGLFSALFALREDGCSVDVLKGFIWAVPVFLPTSAAATLMYYALQHDLKIIVVIGAPVFLAIYFGQRQYRNGVQQRMAVMEKAHRETIEALAVAINAKDEVTHDHVLRVQIYAAGVARILGCSDPEIEALKAGALLHDIGKIAVPDHILNKPGKLTAAEFEKMKIHTIAGAQILSRVEFPYPIVPVVRHHHERWDGHGYPDGLSGEDIPLTARILTVVDCFDAVREDRQYRKAMTREEAIDLIIRGSGAQYDPTVVGAFIAHLPEFETEIRSHRGSSLPTFGIEPTEQLSEAARLVPPAAGLAEDEEAQKGASGAIQDELTALTGLAQGMIGARSRDEIVNALAVRLQSIVPYCLCTITLVDPRTGQNVVVGGDGPQWMLLKGRVIGAGEGVTGWVLANRKPFCNTDPKLDLPTSFSEHSQNYLTLAAFPIIKDSIMYGAVSIYSSVLAEYTPAHQKMLTDALSMVASAFSATADSENWENRMPSAGEDSQTRSPLADWIPDYELTH